MSDANATTVRPRAGRASLLAACAVIAGSVFVGTTVLSTDGDALRTPTATDCVDDAYGIPSDGAYVGAAMTGTSFLAHRENQLGQTLPLHRQFYQYYQVDLAMSDVRDDLAHDRLPWISFKLPHSWADMARGVGDAWANDLARRLGALDGPVWIAFHHEPEGDGSLPAWVSMQRHLSRIVHDLTNNVAFTIILTGWQTFQQKSEFHISKLWPGRRAVDLVGVDLYNWYGAVIDHHVIGTSDDLAGKLHRLAAWATRQDVPWAVAETALSNEGAALEPRWLASTYDKIVSLGGVGMAYFDSSLSPLASWTLDTPAKLQAFEALLPLSPRIC